MQLTPGEDAERRLHILPAVCVCVCVCVCVEKADWASGGIQTVAKS